MCNMSRPGPDPEVTDSEILNAIRSREQPYATAGDVADIVSLSRWRTSERLQRLADAGTVESGAVGERATIYWLDSG